MEPDRLRRAGAALCCPGLGAASGSQFFVPANHRDVVAGRAGVGEAPSGYGNAGTRA